MSETTPWALTTFPKKWAMIGMFASTIILSIIVEFLDRLPVITPLPWWVWAMIISNFSLIILALAFVTLASKNMWQQLGNSALMIGTLTLLLGLYSLVPT